MWYKVNKIYIYQNWQEEQVYPAPLYEYSYTFKWKTTSQIQSDWWTLLTWSLNVNSNWVTWSSSQDCRLAKSIPSLSNAKRIIIQYTVVSAWNTASATSWLIWYGSWWWTSATWYNIRWSTYTGMTVSCKTTWTTVLWNVVWYASSTTYTSTITIDLENKTLVWAVSWFSNSTLSLNDTQVNDIRNNYNQLIAYVSINYDSISDISIKVY